MINQKTSSLEHNSYCTSDKSLSTHTTDLLDFDSLSDFANLRVFEVHEHYRLKTRASKLQRVMSDIISALAKNPNIGALETLNIPGRVFKFLTVFRLFYCFFRRDQYALCPLMDSKVSTFRLIS